MKKMAIAIAAVAALSMTMATGAMAAPHGHGGHMGGGGAHFSGGRGGHGGFGGGGFALGAGLGALYDFAGPGYYGCYQQRLVPTPFGLRYRTVDVCGY
jgi:hypothetical protein